MTLTSELLYEQVTNTADAVEGASQGHRNKTEWPYVLLKQHTARASAKILNAGVRSIEWKEKERRGEEARH